MKAIYHHHTNTLEQLPSMEKPDNDMRPRGDNAVWESDEWRHKWQAYNAHIASLQRIPCDPSCREIWADKQEVVEGKDYEVKNNDYLPPPLEEMIIAVPLSAPVQEDELWMQLFDFLPRGFLHSQKLEAIEEWKNNGFHITKKITP